MRNPTTTTPSPSRRWTTTFAALLALGAVACGGEDPHSPGPAVTPPAPIEGDPSNVPPVVADAQPKPPPVERAAFVRAVRGVFDTWSEREAELVKAWEPGFKKALGELRWFKRLSTQAYEAREYKPIFSEGQQLAVAADKLLEALYAVEDHGLVPDPYALDALREQVKAFSEASLAHQKALTVPAESQAVWTFLSAQRKRLPLDDAALEAAAAAANLSDADLQALDKAKGSLTEILSTREQLNAALRDLDIALLTRYFRYVYDMRFSKRAHPFFADKSDGDGIERTAEDIYAFYEKTDFAKIDEAFAELTPKIWEYEPIMKGLARYRALAAKYPVHLELGRKVERLKKRKNPKESELTRTLQERLAQEGFYDGEIDGLFDDEVEAGITHYQELHQLKETGTITRGTRIALNITYAERAEQIALALRRHRESDLHQGEFRFGETPLRGRVNIPAFQATFYKDGEIARQHRVIVGNNRVEVNFESGKKGRYNQTRMFTAEMKTVVLNPTWRVPKRIKEQELDLKLMDEPDFYEKHNYEVTIRADGTESVMQLPGPNNALGLVKFLFPNQFAIYMHDTPKKRLFSRPVRAFSHGCMRTENPLDLARWLLVEQGDWDDDRFDKVLKSRQEYGVALKERVPMTIDYNTIGIHESGRLMFYSDIYKYDRDYFDGKTPYPRDRDHYQTVIIN